MDSNPKLTLFSWVGSQWAGVAHLGLAEKGFNNHEVDVREIDLIKAENFHPEYLKINPNGTVPSLTSSCLSEPLVDTRQILEFLDQSRPSRGAPDLIPAAVQDKIAANALIELVHSSELDTGCMIFGCLDEGDLHRLQASPLQLMAYIVARQTALNRYHRADPKNAFYAARLEENSKLYSIFTGASSADRVAYFSDTAAKYKTFAVGLHALEQQIRLPYATGNYVTVADLHMVPWLSHTLFVLGTSDPSDFSKLEERIRQAVPGFELGPNIPKWWNTFRQRESFRKVFEVLH